MARNFDDPANIDLNTATEGELNHIPGLGLERVRLLISQRPFEQFNDLRKVPGFSESLIKELQQHGATLGKRRAA